MHTTRTDRENRVERAIKNFEESKRRFFRMDGSKLFGEAEHAERMERLVSELREEVQEEIEGAEADAAQPSHRLRWAPEQSRRRNAHGYQSRGRHETA